jgi:UDP-galactopyranose mutase
VKCPSSSSCATAEEMAMQRVGKELYEKIFKDYTEKQWNMSARNLDASVTARIPVRNNFDGRYFDDTKRFPLAAIQNGLREF